MPKRSWVIVIVLLVVMAVFFGTCASIAYLGYRAIVAEPAARVGDMVASDLGANSDVASGTLKLYGSLPPTLDPAMVQDSTSAEYVVHLFAGLVTLDSELHVQPDLATGWSVADDGCTFTFDLAPDAAFQDGRAIIADDWIYSLERACSPELGSPVAVSYLGDIVGVQAYATGAADTIAGLSVVDNYALRMVIDAPKAYFLAKLTYPTAFVVDRNQIERDGARWFQEPNASGPFVLADLDASRLVLEPNASYRGSKPEIRRVEFILDGGIPISMYENGEIDIAYVAAGELDRIFDPQNPLHAQYVMAPELSVQYLAFNVQRPPFDDEMVRQAFAHAIDREKLAGLVLNGAVEPAAGILPSVAPDYNPSLAILAYDPVSARSLLASSRYAAVMPDIVLSVSGTSGYMSATTRAIIGMIEENLGIAIRVEQVAWGDFLQDLNRQEYQMYSSGWIGDYPDSQNFLDLLFYSKSPQNHTGYASARVDELLLAARLEQDVNKRSTLYQEAEQEIVLDSPWVPLTYGASHMLVKPYVRGYQVGGSLYPWLRDISIED